MGLIFLDLLLSQIGSIKFIQKKECYKYINYKHSLVEPVFQKLKFSALLIMQHKCLSYFFCEYMIILKPQQSWTWP